MSTNQVRVVNIGVIQVSIGLHLCLNCLNHFALTEKLVVDLDASYLLERLCQHL